MNKETKEVLAQEIMYKVNEDEAFTLAFLKSEDAPALQKVLSDYGFDITVEDVEAIFADGLEEILKVKKAEESGELLEDDLENVAGGGVLRGLLRTTVSAAAGFGFGALCGICPAAAGATNAVAGGLTLWSAAGFKKKGW